MLKNKLILLAMLLGLSIPSLAANQRAFGYCEDGGQTVTTQGLPSTTKVQRSYPSCQIDVYLTGTTTHATIYSDTSNTPLANPFTAASDGYWFWYAADGTYDVKLSMGGITTPFTRAGYFLNTSTGGGGGTPSGPAGGDLMGTYPNPGVAKVNGLTPGGACINSFTRTITSSARPTCDPVDNASLVHPSTTVNGQTCTLGSTCTVTSIPGGSAGGDLGSTFPNPMVVNGSHITNSSIPNSGLVNVSTAINGVTCTLGSTCTIGAAPTGSAGGDLGSTYPNPIVLHGNHITDASIPNSGLVNAKTTVNSVDCTLGSTCTIVVAGSAGGDLTGPFPNPTVAKINGTSVPINSSADQTLITTASATALWKSVPDCGDSVHALSYATATHTFGCQAIPGGASFAFPVNPQTSTYQVLLSDFQTCSAITVASGTFTITLVDVATQPINGTCIWIVNYGSGVITVARSGQNINGSTSSLTISAGSASAPNGLFVVSDGSNYFAQVFGAGASGTAGGDLTGTYPNPTLVTTAVSPASYGDATHVATFTVDSKGRLTAAASVAITGAAPTGSAGGDLTGTYPNPTVAKVNGVAYGTSPSTNTVPVVTGTNVITYEAVPNAALANSATTPNGQTCTLGSTCNVNVGAAAHSLALNQGNGSAITGLALGAHQVPVGTAAADPNAKTVPDCTDTGGNHLNFTQSTDAFSCGTSGSASQLHSVTFSINGNGSAISTGALGIFPSVKYACTINQVDVSGTPSGSITVDIWKAAGAIPTSGNKISASAPATLSSSTLNLAGSISGWSTSVSSGDVFGGTIVTASTVTAVTVTIWCQ